MNETYLSAETNAAKTKIEKLFDRRLITVFVLMIVVVWLSLAFLEKPLYARAGIIAGVCLILWLSEIVPAFVPSLLLWSFVPLLLSPFGAEFRLAKVLSWAAGE